MTTIGMETEPVYISTEGMGWFRTRTPQGNVKDYYAHGARYYYVVHPDGEEFLLLRSVDPGENAVWDYLGYVTVDRFTTLEEARNHAGRLDRFGTTG